MDLASGCNNFLNTVFCQFDFARIAEKERHTQFFSNSAIRREIVARGLSRLSAALVKLFCLATFKKRRISRNSLSIQLFHF
jgi:hypothetical protein